MTKTQRIKNTRVQVLSVKFYTPCDLDMQAKNPKSLQSQPNPPKQVNQIKKKTSLDTKAALNPSRQNH